MTSDEFLLELREKKRLLKIKAEGIQIALEAIENLERAELKERGESE